MERNEHWLRWKREGGKQQGGRARDDRVRRRLAVLWGPSARAALSVLFSIFQYFQPVPAEQSAPNPALHFLLMTPISAIATFLLAALLTIGVGALDRKSTRQKSSN